MQKYHSVIKTETIALSVGQDGFWLYDNTRGMNLAIRAESEQKAFIEAIEYYQKRLTEVERCYNSLQGQVDSFVSQFRDDADN